MHNAPKPNIEDLPTPAQLRRSTIIAGIGAVAIGLMVYLPAEYGTDPTGLGSILGLTEMGEIKTQLAEEAEADRLLDLEGCRRRPVLEPARRYLRPVRGVGPRSGCGGVARRDKLHAGARRHCGMETRNDRGTDRAIPRAGRRRTDQLRLCTAMVVANRLPTNELVARRGTKARS